MNYMLKQDLLFPKAEIPRAPRIVRMHVIDAGLGCCDAEPGEQHVRFKCPKCDTETDWESMPSISAAKRGIPCHNCNQTSDGETK